MEKLEAILQQCQSTGPDISQESNIPIKFHVKPSDSILEGMQILERVEGQLSNRRSSRKCLQELAQVFRNATLRPATINRKCQVLLCVAQQSEFGSSVNRKANE
jgi:hypothetical protein